MNSLGSQSQSFRNLTLKRAAESFSSEAVFGPGVRLYGFNFIQEAVKCSDFVHFVQKDFLLKPLGVRIQD